MNQPLPSGFYFETPSVSNGEQSPAPRRTHGLYWVVVAVNVLFLAWMVFGVKSVADSTCTPAMAQLACDLAKASSKSVGTLMAGLLWVAVDVILAGVWLARNSHPVRRAQSEN
jgi:hypothetical protein